MPLNSDLVLCPVNKLRQGITGTRYQQAMQRFFVMTVIGADRPGLVDSMASAILARGGNWLESRMCHLGGQFAGIVRVEVAEVDQAALLQDLKNLEETGLQFVIHAEASAASIGPRNERRLARLEVVGQDRPGIVRQIAHELAAHSVNVEEFNSAVFTAPMSAEVLFKAEAQLRMPEECDLARLRHGLERIAGDLMVELVLEGWDAPSISG